MEPIVENLEISRATTQDNVVDQLRKLILSHYFKPRDRLPQDKLAGLLGVSRTPIREALLKLAGEGLVIFSPYKGASVADFSIKNLNEIYNVRIALEGFASNLAAQRITDSQVDQLSDLLRKMKLTLDASDLQKLLQLNRKFHTGIYSAAEEGRLLELINNHLDQAEVYRRIFVNLDHCREEMVNHREMLVALRNHDPVLAEQLTRHHLRKTAEKLTDFFSGKLE